MGPSEVATPPSDWTDATVLQVAGILLALGVPTMIWAFLRYATRRPDPVLTYHEQNGLSVRVRQRSIRLGLFGPRQPISDLRIIYRVVEAEFPSLDTPRAAGPARFRDLLEPDGPPTTTVTVTAQSTVAFSVLDYVRNEPRIPVGATAYAPAEVGSYICTLDMAWHGGRRKVEKMFTVPSDGRAYWASA